jgi:hypothetical protein
MIVKRLALSALVAVIGLAEPRAGEAILIQLVYDPGADGIDPCSTFVIHQTPEGPVLDHVQACTGGVDRTPDLTLHIGLAAAHWERIFKDDHVLTISTDGCSTTSLPGAVTSIDGQGRPLEGIVRIPGDFTWYYDPNPLDDDEFSMSPKLYRTLHPDERTEAISGTPPEVFEVGYNGTNMDLPPDLLTVGLHEVGHILGLAGDIWNAPPAKCEETAAGAYYQLDPVLVGGRVGESEGARVRRRRRHKFDCSHLALGGITACKTASDQTR